jgi:hypothetical protein
MPHWDGLRNPRISERLKQNESLPKLELGSIDIFAPLSKGLVLFVPPLSGLQDQRDTPDEALCLPNVASE